jgi:pimeloyl-ACP methyl ester carboxylesterase
MGSYSRDHIGLLDHLKISRCHLLSGCIGSSYCLGLIKSVPDRVSAAVLQNPIGLSDKNREMFRAMFDGWAEALRPSHAEIDEAGLRAFREGMYGGHFVFNVSREFVRSVRTPLLVLMGSDDYHPTPHIGGDRPACSKRSTDTRVEDPGSDFDYDRACAPILEI